MSALCLLYLTAAFDTVDQEAKSCSCTASSVSSVYVMLYWPGSRRTCVADVFKSTIVPVCHWRLSLFAGCHRDQSSVQDYSCSTLQTIWLTRDTSSTMWSSMHIRWWLPALHALSSRRHSQHRYSVSASSTSAIGWQRTACRWTCRQNRSGTTTDSVENSKFNRKLSQDY